MSRARVNRWCSRVAVTSARSPGAVLGTKIVLPSSRLPTPSPPAARRRIRTAVTGELRGAPAGPTHHPRRQPRVALDAGSGGLHPPPTQLPPQVPGAGPDLRWTGAGPDAAPEI